MPPSTKYPRIHHSQFGAAAKCSAGGIGRLSAGHARAAEREDAGDEPSDRGHGAAEITGHVVARWELRVLGVRQVVRLRLVHQQEERVEAAVHLRIAAVELRGLVARALERRD